MRYIFIINISIFFLSCISQGEKKIDSLEPFKGDVLSIHPDSLPINDTIDFGKIRMGEMVEQTIRIKNLSNVKPFVVLSHDNSCGCTTLEYDKKPVAPDQYKDITFTFNSKAADVGRQLKLVKLHTSFADKPYRFYIMAQVE